MCSSELLGVASGPFSLVVSRAVCFPLAKNQTASSFSLGRLRVGEVTPKTKDPSKGKENKEKSGASGNKKRRPSPVLQQHALIRLNSISKLASAPLYFFFSLSIYCSFFALSNHTNHSSSHSRHQRGPSTRPIWLPVALDPLHVLYFSLRAPGLQQLRHWPLSSPPLVCFLISNLSVIPFACLPPYLFISCFLFLCLTKKPCHESLLVTSLAGRVELRRLLALIPIAHSGLSYFCLSFSLLLSICLPLSSPHLSVRGFCCMILLNYLPKPSPLFSLSLPSV